jgi:hypothetical protein
MSYIKKEKIIQKVYKNIDASVSSQLGTSTYTTITGSNASYEPHEDASYIVYDFSFVSHSNSSINHNLFLALTYDTGGSETGHEYLGITDAYNDGHYILRAKFLIPTYSGSKNWQLKFRTNNTGNWFPKLHEDEDGNVCYPTLIIYSIT